MHVPYGFALILLLPLLEIGCSTQLLELSPPPEDVEPAEASMALQQYLDMRAAAGDTTDAYRPYIALLSIEDDSGFREGIFELEHEIPRMLTEEMGKQSLWRMVPFQAVLDAVATTPKGEDDHDFAVAEMLKADFVGRGRLVDFNLERLQAGDVMIGGYKSYHGVAELEIVLYRVSNRSGNRTVHSRKEVTDRGLGIDLLGKPRKQDVQFMGLQSMEFGSEDFLGTAIGQATAEALDAIVVDLRTQLQPTIDLEGTGAKIISVDGDEIFINLGSQSGIHPGFRFRVLPGKARALSATLDATIPIATVEVVDVIGNRLARVRRISGGGPSGTSIASDDRLQFVKPPE